MKSIPHYDLHVVQRDKNIRRLQGSRRPRSHQDPDRLRTHHPLPATAHPRRPYLVGRRPQPRRLLHRHPLRRPRRRPSSAVCPRQRQPARLPRRHLRQPPLLASAPSAPKPPPSPSSTDEGELYLASSTANAIWRSKINLSFLTHSNQDEFVHKSLSRSQAASGFLLAERSPGHLGALRPKTPKPVFFSTFEELTVEKIRRYLPDEPARDPHRGRRPCERAVRGGYSIRRPGRRDPQPYPLDHR